MCATYVCICVHIYICICMCIRFWNTIYCVSFTVKNFCCFTSLPSFHKNVHGYSFYKLSKHSCAKTSQKTFTVVNQSVKNANVFIINNKQYMVLLYSFIHHIAQTFVADNFGGLWCLRPIHQSFICQNVIGQYSAKVFYHQCIVLLEGR